VNRYPVAVHRHTKGGWPWAAPPWRLSPSELATAFAAGSK
jgi:hypothetical protein